jgi:hypothetical protein
MLEQLIVLKREDLQNNNYVPFDVCTKLKLKPGEEVEVRIVTSIQIIVPSGNFLYRIKYNFSQSTDDNPSSFAKYNFITNNIDLVESPKNLTFETYFSTDLSNYNQLSFQIYSVVGTMEVEIFTYSIVSVEFHVGINSVELNGS